MAAIQWQDLDDGVVRISLDNGPGNPLSRRLLDELDSALGDLEADPPRALVLDGGTGKLFSGGFDVVELLSYDRRDARRFFYRFFDALARLTALPTPTIAAIHGAAIAGGFLLPLGCDLRVAQAGDYKLGLSEVDLGVCVPAAGQVLLAARTNGPASMRLSLFATLLSPDDAADVGYADVIADDAQAEAIELAQALAAKPGHGATATKAVMGATLAATVREANARGIDVLVDTWFSDTAQDNLRALAQRLKA